MVKRSENGEFVTVWLQGHGLSVGFETPGPSSRVRRAAPSLQMQTDEPVEASYDLPRRRFDHAVAPTEATRQHLRHSFGRGREGRHEELPREGGVEAPGSTAGSGRARREGGVEAPAASDRRSRPRATTRTPRPGWSNATKSSTWAASGGRATASRRSLRRRASPHECEGQPQAFRCSLWSPWWPAMASPRRPL